MSKSSCQFIDVSFLIPHGYIFSNKIHKNLKNSLVKVKFEDSTGLSTDIACKVIDRKKKTKDERLVEMLKNICHPNIVTVHSMFQNEFLLFVFLQWMEDGNLLDWIRKNGAVDEKIAKKWFLQMLSAIKFLHDHRVSHGNLCCKSILISRDGIVKISGLSYLTSNHDRKLKIVKSSVPSFYLAPGVLLSTPCNPCNAGIFSLGVILFIMINNKIPFTPSNTTQLIDDQKNRRYHTRNSMLHKISIECQVFLDVLLEPDTTLRWPVDKILNLKWVKS